MIDIGFDYFIVKFACDDNYDYVMTQGRLLIGDSNLTNWKWVPNFILDEEPIHIMTAWIRIPRISVKYFNEEFRIK